MRPESLADIDFEKAYAPADLARDYWSPVSPSSPEEFRRLGQAKLEMLRDLGLTPRSRVLDVGCGTGSLTEALLPFLAPEGLYLGTDISDVAVRFCREKYAGPTSRSRGAA